jgi:hypothetical protein
MSIRQFFLKQAAKVGTHNLPKDQQEMIMTLMEKDPALFENIAKEIKALTDAGKPEMYASFEVMQKYQSKLAELLKDEDPNKLKQMAQAAMEGK